MKVQLGLKAQRIPLPGGDGYVELKKLGGPGRTDFSDLSGAPASVRARFVWDRAVVGYRLPVESEDGRDLVEWPVPRSRRDETPTPDEVFEGIDEDFLAWLLAAFAVQNELLREEFLLLTRWVVKAGFDGVPPEALSALQSNATPDEALLAQAREALGAEAESAGEALGNSPVSSGTSSVPDGAATSESDTP